MKQDDSNKIEVSNTPIEKTTIGNDLTPQKSGFLSTKKGKIIVFSILGVVLIGLIIGIAIACSKGGEKTLNGNDNNNGNNGNDNGKDNGNDNGSEADEVNKDPNIIYKKNDVSVYIETQSKNANIELSENIPLNERKLAENSNILSKKTEITSQYLVNIYDEKEENSLKVYYAYASVLNMKKKVENKEEVSMGGKDIREINSVNEETPVVKFSFNENGEMKYFKVNEKMNVTLASYLYEFVQKVIPDVLKKKSLNDLPKIKSLKQIEKEEEIKKQQNEEKKNIKTEKTTTTNYSDEENKNNTLLGKKEVKQIEEIKIDKIGFVSINGFEDDVSGLDFKFTGEDIYGIH